MKQTGEIKEENYGLFAVFFATSVIKCKANE